MINRERTIRSVAERRAGFTLVELLVVMAIIAILTGAALGTMYAAEEAGRRAKTEATVAKLHSVIMQRYEEFLTRRIPADISANHPFDFAPGSPFYGKTIAIRRLTAMRQMLRMELPDRWADVVWEDFYSPQPPPEEIRPYYTDFLKNQWPRNNNPSVMLVNETKWAIDPAGNSNVDVLQNRTALSAAYRRRYDQVTLERGMPPSLNLQGAECLYLIVTTGVTRGVGREHFNESEIDDTDNDGMPEFIDGWGRPITFLRWAPGFVSETQPYVVDPNDMDPFENDSGVTPSDPEDPNNMLSWVHRREDHDPFDPRIVDPIAFRLTPLIYSAGPDGVYGVTRHDDDPTMEHWLCDPYDAFDANGVIRALKGSPLSDAARAALEQAGETIPSGGELDNIHNHALGARR